MKAKETFGQPNAKRLGLAALYGCIAVAIIFVALVKSNSHQFAILSLQLSIRTYGPFSTMEEEGGLEQIGANSTSLPLQLRVVQDRNDSITGAYRLNFLPAPGMDGEPIKLLDFFNEKPYVNNSNTGNNIILQESKLACDFSESRSDTCSVQGDVRILPKSSTIILASSSENSTAKIRPYARKWESPVMQQINEVTITPLLDPKFASVCSANHSVPAVIFSTGGGFLGNFFHDFTDVLVPLFVTSRHFQGEVQFLVTGFNLKWIKKYGPILKKLSKYEIIDMDSDAKTHCYPEAHLGLLSHKVLGINPSKTPNAYSMVDFRQFLRTCYNLNRGSTKVIQMSSRKKPRLLMILRKGSRSFMNARQVLAMARSIGYIVITAGPDDTKDTSKFARVVNSCDVMMGVHGAGLANMVFLPTNASLIQIVPWGGLKWACWHDFGEPAPNMGLNYVEYEIKEEESSLIEEYPRDHAVFKDPMSIHRQGWNQLWSIFLDKQKVKLDVGRFRGVLLEIYQKLKK